MQRRPALTLIAPGASPVEAAAIVAALEHFRRETAPVAAEEVPAVSPWLRAGRLEAVGREADRPLGGQGGLSPWGDSSRWA